MRWGQMHLTMRWMLELPMPPMAVGIDDEVVSYHQNTKICMVLFSIGKHLPRSCITTLQKHA
ncbi:hypothetical protein Plhal304r1_c039g0117041 [Plasmopara halstedii]